MSGPCPGDGWDCHRRPFHYRPGDVGAAQALPNRPECCIDGVAATAEQGLRSTPAGGQVHDIHAVEAHWFYLPFEVTRSHEIGLVAGHWGPRRQGRIGGAFRLITAGTPLNQIMPTQNPVDRAQGRQRPDVLVLQLHRIAWAPQNWACWSSLRRVNFTCSSTALAVRPGLARGRLDLSRYQVGSAGS